MLGWTKQKVLLQDGIQVMLFKNYFGILLTFPQNINSSQHAVISPLVVIHPITKKNIRSMPIVAHQENALVKQGDPCAPKVIVRL